MASLTGWLKERVAGALGAVAAEGEQDTNIAPNEVVHRGCHIDRAPRGPKYCSAMVMNLVNKCGRDHHRFGAPDGVKTLITTPEPRHFQHPVSMMDLPE